MSIADSGKAVGPVAVTDAGYADQLKRLLLRQVRTSKKTLMRTNTVLANSPGGAQGCVNALSAEEYAEFITMINDVASFFATHKLTGDDAIVVTIPAQS